MRTAMRLLVAVCALAGLSPAALAQPGLRQELKDIEIAPHWIYDDLPEALAQARKTGKPILIVFRCVPCPPGRTLDLKVMKPDRELEKLEQQFICVRIVKTNGMDLKLFQFDYDQSWTAVFMNADKVLYGRYGTRASSGPRSDTYLSLPSFRKAMERALEVHKGYPGNKEQLAGKIGKEAEYPLPERIPGLEERGKEPTTRKTCIHCHMVREYALRARWQGKRLSPADLWVFPLPDNIGLTMDLDDGLLVKSVAPGSLAARGGLAAGDELVTLNGQPLLSLADIQWVLHTSPSEGKLAVTLQRDGKKLDRTIALSGKWKESDLAWRASSWYGLRYGVKIEPLPAAEKRKRGLGDDALALVVKGLFGKGGPQVQKAGLRVGDVIVAIDGKMAPMTESQFLAYLRLAHGPEDRLRLTILRGDRRQELTIPLW
ncbi:MAG: PDZ domain-containing protein [Gemmataceae bacterium]|nr:PDZ domain-containing protein [Gemmataceae bacterium]